MMTNRDVHAIACVVEGVELNGHRDALSGPGRSIVDALLAEPIEDRGRTWGLMCKARDDGLELLDRVQHCDTTADPAEDDDQDDADGWGPLRYGASPPAPEFPLHVFPDPVSALVRAVETSVGCAPDYPAAAVLAIASGAIGRSVSLRLKPNYFTSASVYIAIVGPPSDGKSPTLQHVRPPINQIDSRLQLEHDQAVELRGESSEGDGSKKTKGEPEAPRLTVDDTTPEKLVKSMAENPRGLLMLKDELSALFSGMDQYRPSGKGSERSLYLAAWSSTPIRKDRMTKDGSSRVDHPYLSICGNLVPSNLNKINARAAGEDGLIERFLFAFPEPRPIPGWNRTGVEQTVADAWRRVVLRLWDRPMDSTDSGQEFPHVLYLEGDAEVAWVAMYDCLVSEMNSPEFDQNMRACYGKAREYAARFALILCLLDHAASNADPASLPKLEPRHIAAGFAVAKYFLSMTARVFREMSGGTNTGGPDVLALVKWIVRTERSEFSLVDVGNNFKRFKDDPATLADTIAWMESRNLIRIKPAPVAPASKRGRKPSPRWEVNPSLRKSLHLLRLLRNSDHGGQVGDNYEVSEVNEGTSEDDGGLES